MKPFVNSKKMKESRNIEWQQSGSNVQYEKMALKEQV
jgi:hypothetical protein